MYLNQLVIDTMKYTINKLFYFEMNGMFEMNLLQLTVVPLGKSIHKIN